MVLLLAIPIVRLKPSTSDCLCKDPVFGAFWGPARDRPELVLLSRHWGDSNRQCSQQGCSVSSASALPVRSLACGNGERH